MSGKITFFYYTAWNGYAWQGCDESTAGALQRYMDATGTLPSSPADKPPFGGAVPCKLSGQVGVAVYRYHIREHGDAFNRNSLYISLAFIPLEVGCVDFAALLELPQMTTPKHGELKPEEMPADGLLLRCGDAGGAWWDGDGAVVASLSGRDGLRHLSQCFFSERTQLGFLRAVFMSKAGVDQVESTQTYSIYPEVAKVLKASEELSGARRRAASGYLRRDSPAVVKMERALADFKLWAEQLGYGGLMRYHAEKEAELRAQYANLEKVVDYVNRAESLLCRTKNIMAPVDKNADSAGWGKVADAVKNCINVAGEAETLPLFEDEQSRKAMKCAFSLFREAIRLQGEAIKRSCNANMPQDMGERRGNKTRLSESRREPPVAVLESIFPIASGEGANRGGDDVRLHRLASGGTLKGGDRPGFRGMVLFGIAIVAAILILALAVVAFLARSSRGDQSKQDDRTTVQVQGAPSKEDKAPAKGQGASQADFPAATPLGAASADSNSSRGEASGGEAAGSGMTDNGGGVKATQVPETGMKGGETNAVPKVDAGIDTNSVLKAKGGSKDKTASKTNAVSKTADKTPKPGKKK